MPNAVRVVARLQDQDDVNVTPGVGTAGYFLTWDNASSKFVLADHLGAADPHTGYLLASGARDGASAGVQTFTNGVIMGKPLRVGSSNGFETASLIFGMGTWTTGWVYGIGFDLYNNATTNNTIYGATFWIYQVQSTTGSAGGMQVIPAVTVVGGTVAYVHGLDAIPKMTVASNVTWMSGVRSRPQVSGGTVTNCYNVWARGNLMTAGAVTNRYGMYIEEVGATVITNSYGLYIEGMTKAATLNYAIYSAGGQSYFGGSIGIGTITPGYPLHVVGNGYFAGSVGVNVAATNSVLEVNGDFRATRPAVATQFMLFSGDSSFNRLRFVAGSAKPVLITNTSGSGVKFGTGTAGSEAVYFSMGNSGGISIGSANQNSDPGDGYLMVNTRMGVGLGTVTPGYPLHVVGTSYLNGAVQALGRLTLVGAARVVNDIPIPLSALAKGASAPTLVYLGNYAGFSFTTDDMVYHCEEMPYDWDSSTALLVEIHWYVDEAVGTPNKEIAWELYYTATKEDGTELVNAATATVASGDIVIPTLAKALTQTTFSIAAAGIAPDDVLGLILKRVAIAGGTAPTAKPVLVGMMLEYTANSLGEAVA